jgi:hypothetical protein
MQIIEIGSKAESFNCAFDVLLDVSGRIGDCARAEDIKATLRGNCSRQVRQ